MLIRRMIIAQVCLRLATIKGHSKRCSFNTQHNASDVRKFEGACNWHADCRMSPPEAVARELNVHFSTIKPSPKACQRIAGHPNRPHNRRTTCNHNKPRTSTSTSSTSKIVWDQPPGQLLQHRLHNKGISAQTVRKPSQGSSSACSSSSSGSRPDCSLSS